MKSFRLVITGNPGTGKHTSAILVAKRLKTEIIDINKVAVGNDVVAADTSRGLEIDVKKVGKLLTTRLATEESFIVIGHLAPYVLNPAGIDMVAVLRRSPAKLEETLNRRGYTEDKVKENVSAEVLGILLYDSIEAFGKRKVAEFDTTGKTPDQTADDIIATLQKKKPRHAGTVDWLAVVSEEEVQKFFSY